MFLLSRAMPKTQLSFSESEFAVGFPIATLDAKMREGKKVTE